MLSASMMPTQRQRLRAIVDRNADLFDPPNTAEAFARLEAAMDEANYQSSVDSDVAGQNDMLDPPNTAERFARIEAAMDAVFANSVTATWTQRHRKKFKLGNAVPLQHLTSRSMQDLFSQKIQPLRSVTSEPPNQPQTQMPSNGNLGNNGRQAASNLLERSIHDNDNGPDKGIESPAEGTHVFPVADSTQHGSKPESQRDVDIFRSSVAMDDFANKAYQSARAKYL